MSVIKLSDIGRHLNQVGDPDHGLLDEFWGKVAKCYNEKQANKAAHSGDMCGDNRLVDYSSGYSEE